MIDFRWYNRTWFEYDAEGFEKPVRERVLQFRSGHQETPTESVQWHDWQDVREERE